MTRSISSVTLRTAVAVVALVPMAASAAIQDVPEPGSWALVGLGLVAAIAVTLSKRK